MNQRAALTDVVLIGVDGGATEVKAHAVACDDPANPSSFELRPASASRRYERVPGFEPLPAAEQLAQRGGDDVRLSAAEEEQGAVWVEAACQAIAEVARRCDAQRMLVGMGMPGLKTPDGRGICVINNGPRIPDYLDRLERGLRAAGVGLLSPVAALGSDADYCGLGEQYAAEGLFRDVESAYYVGGGTGLADAMKLRGRLMPFDEAKPWILKSWEIRSALGPTFEKLVSARSLNQVYADLASVAPVSNRWPPGVGPVSNRSIPGPGPVSGRSFGFPEAEAAAGEPLAVAWMNTAALVLAELIFERMETIKNGREEAPHRGEGYLNLDRSHEYRGTLLDRVIVGQRLGQIYADDSVGAAFGENVDAYLAAFIAESGDAEMRARYLEGNRLRPGFVRPSNLRAAPALGAAIAAVHALRNTKA